MTTSISGSEITFTDNSTQIYDLKFAKFVSLKSRAKYYKEFARL